MRGGATPTAVVIAAAAVGAAFWLTVHRTAKAVRHWRPSAGTADRQRALASRVDGEGDPVIVLISGLAGSERYWGAAFDSLAEQDTLVVVDPLGFGLSADLQVEGDLSDPATHIRLLDETLLERGLAGRPVVVVGHSMGASLALRWAATTDAVRAVVCFGAPLYRTDEEVQQQMAALGWFESLLSRGPLAEAVCHWMCEHHGAARWAAVAMSPHLPRIIASDAVRHTWAGYIGAFSALIADNGWESAIGELGRRGVAVTLVEGAQDRAPVAGRAASLAASIDSVRVVTLLGDHQLPLARPDACLALIRRASQ